MGFFSDFIDNWKLQGEMIEMEKRWKKTDEEAKKFFDTAQSLADHGDETALWVVIGRYMFGNSGLRLGIIRDKDYSVDYYKAIEYCEKAISRGIHLFDKIELPTGGFLTVDESVELDIAWCYYKLKNYEKAEYWYEKAYEQGIKKALCKVGQMYVDRTDGKNDYEKAIKYFEKSIKNDWFVPDNEFMIARLHYEGKGFPEDKTKGLEMIRAAAKKDSKLAKEYMKNNDLTMGGMLDD